MIIVNLIDNIFFQTADQNLIIFVWNFASNLAPRQWTLFRDFIPHKFSIGISIWSNTIPLSSGKVGIVPLFAAVSMKLSSGFANEFVPLFHRSYFFCTQLRGRFQSANEWYAVLSWEWDSSPLISDDAVFSWDGDSCPLMSDDAVFFVVLIKKSAKSSCWSFIYKLFGRLKICQL